MLAGKSALVTGAGQGIGRAIALRLAAYGATVIVTDIQTDKGEETVALIEASGHHAAWLECDVSDPGAVATLFERVFANGAVLDCAINNAGTEGVVLPVEEYPLDHWDRVMNLNLRAVFNCMQHEITHMKSRGQGSIVNVASILSFVGSANSSAYNASKHGVLGLTRTASLELALKGIRVNAVAPGYIETPMVTERGLKATVGSEGYRKLESLHPMQRLGRPDEIAEAVAWLCSDRASFTTGHALTADGGYLAQ